MPRQRSTDNSLKVQHLRRTRIRAQRMFRGLPADPPRRRRTPKLKLFGFGTRRRRKLF